MKLKYKDDLDEIFKKYPGLRIGSSSSKELNINGCLRFKARYLEHDEIEDKYHVNILISYSFPSTVPTVIETIERIPRINDRHVFKSGELCLGSKLMLKIKLNQNKTIIGFIENCLVPYLYANSFFEEHKKYPWGELKHGYRGLADDYIDLFNINNVPQLMKAFNILSFSKYKAMKMQCPCGCNKRYGTCNYKEKLDSYVGLLSRKEYKVEYNKCKKLLKGIKSCGK